MTLANVDDVWRGAAKIVNNKTEYVEGSYYTGYIELWYGVSDSSGNDERAKVTITVH